MLTRRRKSMYRRMMDSGGVVLTTHMIREEHILGLWPILHLPRHHNLSFTVLPI